MRTTGRYKKFIQATVCLLICLGILMPCVALSDNTRLKREATIFRYLLNAFTELDADNPEAVACGILANIYAEVGSTKHNYDPATEVADDSDGMPSGGICGWHASRFDRLKYEFCDDPDDWDDLDTQLDYLMWELTSSHDFDDTRKRLLSIEEEDGIHGAWYAAYLFCYWFEGPNNRIQSAIKRGSYAELFWNTYVDGDDEPIVSGNPANSKLKLTEMTKYPHGIYSSFCPISLNGRIVSNYPLRTIHIYVTDATGSTVKDLNFTPPMWSGDYWDALAFDIKWDGPDTCLKFQKPLETAGSGSYLYHIDATDASGAEIAESFVFHMIKKTSCTVAFDTGEHDYIPDIIADFGSTVTLPGAVEEDGFVLTGWVDPAENREYDAGDPYVISLTDNTLIAQWERISPPEISLGDFDGDGTLTEDDLHLLGRHLAGIKDLTNTDFCDINGDGSITAADLTALARLMETS